MKKLIFASLPILVLLFFKTADSLAAYNVWETPVVYYDFEGSGSLVKDLIGTNDLTISATSGTATTIKSGGRYGRGVKFNGTTDYASAADSATFSQTGSFSVEAFAKFDSISRTATTIQTVLAKWDETTNIRTFRLGIQTDATGRAFPIFQVSTDGTAANIKTVTGKTQILTGNWYLLTGYYNATTPGTIYIYLNGVREGSTSSVGTSISDTTSNFYLGATKTGAATYASMLTGTTDEVRFYSGTRSDGSIAYAMERAKPALDTRLDDGSGLQALDHSANVNRGALINFPTNNSQWVEGINKAYALTFDGSTNYVDLGNKPQLQMGGTLTIEAWVSPTDLAANYTIVSQPQTNGYTFGITTAGEMTFGALGATTVTTSGAGVVAGSWQYLAVSYNGANAAFYKDARLVGNPVLAAWTPVDGAVFIGRAGSTPNYFKGKMSKVYIYAYARTAMEVPIDRAGSIASFGQPQSLQPRAFLIACPTGYVGVPGDPVYGTKDFCVMKYEAKCAATSDLTTGLTSPDTGYHSYADSSTACTAANSKAVVSVASGYPIANITQLNSAPRCSAIGTNYHLITNAEWMTAARNAERMGSNWFNGTVGTGFMYSGHNDETSGGGNYVALAASTDDTNGYYGTGDSTSACDGRYGNFSAGDDVVTGRACAGQRRTLYLNNGSVVWDLGGNVWEWTSDTITGANEPTGSSTGFAWREYTAITNYGTMSYDLIRPFISTRDATYGIGRIYSDGTPSNSTVYGFLRGGSWSYGSYAGVFTLNLSNTPDISFYNIGFRCAASL